MIKMQRLLELIVALTLMASCNSNRLNDLRIENEINKRIEILNKSYKFSIIPLNLQNHNYDKLKIKISEICKSDSRILYDSIQNIFELYNTQIKPYSDNNIVNQFNILLGLDDLIFKFIPSRLNFSNYKTIVVPNKTELKSGETLNARIYLTVSDSLYEPEYLFIRNGEIYNLLSEKGIGQFNLKAQKKGKREITGKAIYSNELGFKDTIDWNYEFEIK